MAITKPMLPPKAGYVEVELDGERVYKNAATGELLRDEVDKPSAEDDLSSLLVDLSYRVTLLELEY